MTSQTLEQYLSDQSIPFLPAFDGKIERFGDSPDSDSRWLFSALIGKKRLVINGDWRSETKSSFFEGNTEETHSEDSEDLQKLRRELFENLRIQREYEAEQSAYSARILFSQYAASGETLYMRSKRVRALHGARVGLSASGQKFLAVPMKNLSGEICGLQRIFDDKKLFLKGQKTEGLFHVIGGDTPPFIFCEGFATGASLHQATGFCTVITFSARNLSHVVKAFRESNDSQFIICGDDDRFTFDKNGNPKNEGRIQAEKLSAYGVVIFPKFPDHNKEKLTDFNDLAVLMGEEEVKKQIEAAIDATAKKSDIDFVEPLGHLDGIFYYTSSKNHGVIALSAMAHTPSNFYQLLGIDYWKKFSVTDEDGKPGPIPWSQITSDLIQSCISKGIYDPTRVRGRGAWRHDGKLLLHLGEKILYDKKILGLNEIRNHFIYRTAPSLPDPVDSALSAHEGRHLKEACEALSWTQKESGLVLAGFLSVFRIAGAMPWRPHLWITGSAGSGKSTVLEELIGVIGGEWAERVLGNTSEAGIRQRLGEDARPVIFDEAERNDGRKGAGRIRSVLELARVAASPGTGRITKGTPHGKALSFRSDGSFVLSSIRVSLEEEADLSRFFVLELSREKKLGIDQLRQKLGPITTEYADRLFARMTQCYDALIESFTIFQRTLSERFTARESQLRASILSGLWMLENDICPDDASARSTGRVVFPSQIALETKTSDGDEYDCLQHLLMHTIQISTLGNFEKISLFEFLKRCSGSYDPQLEIFGITIHEGNLIVCNSHPELSKFFNDTRWQAAWKQSLLRLPGALPFRSRETFNRSYCTSVPLRICGVA